MTAVLAGCGDLGTAVGLRLVERGYRVLGLRRDIRRLPAEFTGQTVDLRQHQPRLPFDTTLVVVALTADSRTPRAYRDTYVDGLRRVLDAVDRDVAQPPATLLVSSTAVLGVDDGSWIDEDTPTAPQSATGQVLLEAEQLLAQRCPTATVLRLGGLYGPGRGRLVDSVRQGTARIPALPVFTNRIHRDDAAAAIVHLATAQAGRAPVYLGVDDEPADRGEMLRFLAQELGVATPPTDDRPPRAGRGKRCRNDRLRHTGFTFAYPTYREGYRAVLHTGR